MARGRFFLFLKENHSDDELTLTRMEYFSEHDLVLISAHRTPARVKCT